MFKRLLTWLMCAALMLTLLPVHTAFADDGDPIITLTTAKAVGSKITLSIQADPADLPEVWIDLNNNGTEDTGEDVIGLYKQYTVSSQTITIHGKVTKLNCQVCQLTELGLSDTTYLVDLNCDNNQLTSLDVSTNTALASLRCRSNQLASLDVTLNTALNTLDVYDNQLTALDVTQNTLLASLNCEGNQLDSLDVTENAALTYLNVSENQLDTLDLTRNTQITTLWCALNQLASLDVTNLPNLENLNCSANGIETLDLSASAALKELYCWGNQFGSMNLSENPLLQRVYCSDNRLTTLDVSRNTALIVLDGADNLLTSLDVSQNSALRLLHVYRNKINGAEMTALVTGLPARIAADHARMFILDTKAADEGNVVQITDVAIASGKNWSVFDWNNGSEVMYAGSDEVAILQIDNRTPSANDKTWTIHVSSGTLKGATGADLTADVKLTGLPAGLSFAAENNGGNDILITLSGVANTALTTDAAVAAVVKGSAVIEAGAPDSAATALDLWYVGPGTTFVISNESGGYLVDKLIAAGHGGDTLYEVLKLLQPHSGATITDRFMKTLASCPSGSEIFTAKLGDFAGLNNPVGVNADGTLGIVGIYGREYVRDTGFLTAGGYVEGVGQMWFTHARTEAHYIDAGEQEGRRYKAFAIAWRQGATYLPLVIR